MLAPSSVWYPVHADVKIDSVPLEMEAAIPPGSSKYCLLFWNR